MNLKAKILGIAAASMLAVPVFAQETTPAAPGTETAPGTQQLGMMHDNEMLLQELRDIHERLGQIIDQLEGDMGMGAQRQALQQARTDLMGLRTGITTGEDREATGQELARIRGDLERGFEGVTGPDQERWTQLRGQFEQFETRFEAGEEITEEEWDEFTRGFDEEFEFERHQPGMAPGTETAPAAPATDTDTDTDTDDTDTDTDTDLDTDDMDDMDDEEEEEEGTDG